MLLYDADCRFCRFAARCVARLDRHEKLAFLPLHADAAAPLLAQLAESERRESWRLACPDGSLHGCGRGVVPLVRAMGLRRTGSLIDRLSDSALDAAYHHVARRRSVLGSLVSDRPGPLRFP